MHNNQLIVVFLEKLDVYNLSDEEKDMFLKSIIKYLKHNKNDDLKGRTVGYISSKLDKFIEICTAIGISKAEMVHILSISPSIINTVDSFFDKYLVLGVIENDMNSIRKGKLLSKPTDFVVGLQQIYARYKLICESGYNKFSWNSLVHATKSEFANIFVTGAYNKPYQMFSSVEAVNKWLNDVSLDEIDMDSFRELDVNKEIVSRYENNEKGFR